MKIWIAAAVQARIVEEATYLWQRSPQMAERFSNALKRLRNDLTDVGKIRDMPGVLPVPEVCRLRVGDYNFDYRLDRNSGAALAISAARLPMPLLAIDDDFDCELRPAQVRDF